ncbi:MAG: group 1 truncated hemoglobin [Burkholderiales bacterium]|nr:group 1 truncated hemoglobin [Burkholderiales bacterium]
MKCRPLPAAALVLVLAIPLAQAQVPQASQARTTQPGTAPVAADDLLYQQLGGREAIQSFTNDFYDRMLKDPRIAHHFDGINMKYLKAVLADYFCVVAGGPCTYEGVSMTNAHAHLGLTKSDFNALVENLQLAMDAANVPFATQNQLLARMAYFHRDIVTR